MTESGQVPLKGGMVLGAIVWGSRSGGTYLKRGVATDIAVFFSMEEGALVDAEEKALHREVMLENTKNMASLGKD
ncbi:zinc finger protein 558-like [Crotalus tigris]|uniref:zinc finger protein 558-like n=1 Tax=Crotalus tigris TaxID=88082 RepID=UPI00192F96F1|nr:zinc finger protein 558-like [Crotalus tigris]